MRKLLLAAVFCTTSAVAYAQDFCSGPQCGNSGCLSASDDCGGGNFSGNGYTGDMFADFMFQFSYDQSLANSTWDFNRRECYAACRKEFVEKKQDCGAEFGWLSGTSDGYNICINLAREELVECLGPTTLQQCNENWP